MSYSKILKYLDNLIINFNKIQNLISRIYYFKL